MKLFNLKRNTVEIEIPEDTTPNIKYFFKLIRRKFSRLVSINLLAIFQFAPLLAAFLIYFWADTTPTITNPMYPVLQGAITLGEAYPADYVTLFLSSIQLNMPYISITTIIIIGLLILLFALTFGLWNVGLSYLMRELVTGNPVFIFSDMKHAIKRNFKQGFLFGILDFIICAVFIVDILSMKSIPASFIGDVMAILIVAIAVIYIIMRFYLYLMLITFDMSIKKIFKNALIFVPLGIKRSLLAILWIIVMLVINVLIMILYFPLGIALPILYLPAFPMFTATYAAYPTIKKYMIDPN